MTKFNTVAGVFAATVFTACGVCAVNSIVKNTSVDLPRVLMVGSAAGQQWQRTLLGARAAAKEFGVELQSEAPGPDQTAEQQSELVRKIQTAEFDGIAISPEDPASQCDLVNDMAKQTKLVTVGKDAENSKRLCNVGFSQVGSGSKAAWMARRVLTVPGQVVLLSTTSSRCDDEIVRQRLAGFQDRWAANADSASQYPMISVPIDNGSNLPDTLKNSKVALIVAFDVDAAEAAIRAMGARPESERIPIIALDTSEIVLDAIEDGRVSSAVFNDAYEDGYEAIRRLAMYSREDAAGLPTPGYGTVPRSGEIVEKSNVADVRGRMALRESEVGATARLHLSSAKVPGSLLGR